MESSSSFLCASKLQLSNSGTLKIAKKDGERQNRIEFLGHDFFHYCKGKT